MTTEPLAILSRTKALSANQSYVDNIKGRSLHVYALTGAVEMRVGKNRGFSVIERGDKFSLPEGSSFDEVEIRETAGSTASITYRVGDGDVDNSATQISDAVVVNSGSTLETPATVTATAAATSLVAASTTRNEVHIQNLHVSENLWIGDANVGNDGAPRGMKLLAGETRILSTGAQVYGRRGNATSITVGILEVKD